MAKQLSGAFLTTISVERAFNLPLFESYLLIDIRPSASYVKGHIQSSINCTLHRGPLGRIRTGADPDTDGDDGSDDKRLRQEFLEAIVKATREVSPDNYSPVIIVGQGDEGDTEATLVGEMLVDVIKQGGTGGKGDDILRQTLRRGGEIAVLEGGFPAFARHFPLLCIAGENSGCSEMVPTPFLINDRILLGSRAVTLSPLLLEKLHVGAVVCQTGGAGAERFQDVTYLECEVKDSGLQPMDAVWNVTNEFLDNWLVGGQKGANSHRNRVLVQLHGRSRSVSVIAAYLMHQRQLSAEEAVKSIELQCNRTRIDHKLIYFDQLEERGKRKRTKLAHTSQ